MLLVNYDISAPIRYISDDLHENVNINAGRMENNSVREHKIHIREKNGRYKISCEYTDREIKDNGFLEGTYFLGSLKESGGVTSMKGVIITAPIYHSILFLIFSYFIYQCVRIGGFSPVPIILVVFSLFMFKDEFKKQRLIKNYIYRAFKSAYKKLNSKKR